MSNIVNSVPLTRTGRVEQQGTGQGRAGQGRAGQGRAGQGRAGQGSGVDSTCLTFGMVTYRGFLQIKARGIGV